MEEMLPVVYLARHAETTWSLSGQHTGLTDLPLTKRGERNARKLGELLRGRLFALVLTSPLQRAYRTCQLAGFGQQAEIDRDLVEWNYGEYEGLALRKSRPAGQTGIEFVSAVCSPIGGGGVVPNPLRVTTNVDNWFVLTPGNQVGMAVASQPTRIYAGPGTNVNLTVFPTSNPVTVACDVAINGYLVNL